MIGCRLDAHTISKYVAHREILDESLEWDGVCEEN